MSTGKPRYEGVPVNVGGVEYIIPPLNFTRIKKITPLLDGLKNVKDSEIPTPEQMDGFVTIIHLGLSRNYPEMTKEEVEDLIDLGNLRRIIAAIMGVSGFVKGEPVAGELIGPTGIKSMPT